MRIAVIGAGGCAREAECILRRLNSQYSAGFEFAGFVVSDSRQRGQYDSEPIGDESVLAEMEAAVIGIGNPAVRLRVAEGAASRFPHLEWPTLIHPAAVVDRETCTLGKGVVIEAGAVVGPNVTIQDFALIHMNATVGHEAVIGRGSAVNPGANISGGCVIGEAVMIGTGAKILQYVAIGAGAIVGAGAVANKPIAPGVTAVGVPAKAK